MVATETTKKNAISVVISAYNEECNIEALYAELAKILSGLAVSSEMIFVNDGSSDATLQKCLALQEKNPAVKIVNLRRNFGHEIAMTAGMDYATGDAVIFMDADLQHPPRYIADMVAAWQDGAEIVLTRRLDNAATSWFYKFCAKVFYTIFNWFSEIELLEKTPDFRLLDRKYVDFLKGFTEQDRLFRGLISWGIPNTNLMTVDFSAPERFAGTTKYSFRKSLGLAITSIIQFSTKPLRLSFYLGLLTALAALAIGAWHFIEFYIYNVPQTGFTTLILTITFLGAIQLIMIGIIGEYIGKIHLEVKKRPLYIADFIERKG